MTANVCKQQGALFDWSILSEAESPSYIMYSFHLDVTYMFSFFSPIVCIALYFIHVHF